MSDDQKITIKLQHLTGRSITMDVGRTSTTLSLKEYIENLYGIPIRDQRLVYAGHLLEDDKSIDYYNVNNDSIIYLIYRLMYL
jgi:hypothetical protein